MWVAAVGHIHFHIFQRILATALPLYRRCVGSVIFINSGNGGRAFVVQIQAELIVLLIIDIIKQRPIQIFIVIFLLAPQEQDNQKHNDQHTQQDVQQVFHDQVDNAATLGNRRLCRRHWLRLGDWLYRFNRAVRRNVFVIGSVNNVSNAL